MFTRVRNRLGEPFGKHKPAGPAAGEKKAGEGQAEDTLVRQISSLEEMVNKRTQELEQAKSQLSQLTSNDSPVEIEEDGAKAAQADGFFVKPNQVGTPPGKAKEAEGQSPLAVKGKEAEAEPVAKPPEAPAGAEGDSFSDLFSRDEAEENPLAGLINSLPDAAAAELLSEAREIQTMMRQWQTPE